MVYLLGVVFVCVFFGDGCGVCVCLDFVVFDY